MTSPDYLKSAGKAHSQPIPHDVKKAVAYMREAIGRKISMAELVEYCGVAERTLHKHFRAFMAVSPLEYWRRLRLTGVREDLLKGASDTSISEVATRFGFNHFGRFSQQYRRSFGETPSATLRRSRVDGRQQSDHTRDNCADDAGIISSAPLVSRERPSVAVLPCQVSAAERQYRYFGESVTEGMAIALGRARSLSVVLPRPLQALRPLEPKRAAQEAGAKYALISTVAPIGERVRITIHLLDAITGFHVWGDTYDGAVEDLFGLQNRLTEGVTRAVLPHIRGAEIKRVQRKVPGDLDAHGLTMRAFPFVLATYPGAAKRALDLLNQAMERDPDYAPATALAAACHAQLVLHNGTKSPSQERSRALQLSDRASILDPDDPLVLTARCAVHTMAGQLDHAGALIARALACEPTFVWGWERSGWLKAFAGEPEAAIKHFEQATHLDPHTLNANRLMGIGCAHFDAGRYEQATWWKRKGLQEQPGMEWINRTLCVSYAQLGERRAALDSLDALHRYSPDLTISKIVNALPFPKDFLDRVSEGLNDLGLPA